VPLDIKAVGPCHSSPNIPTPRRRLQSRQAPRAAIETDAVHIEEVNQTHRGHRIQRGDRVVTRTARQQPCPRGVSSGNNRQETFLELARILYESAYERRFSPYVGSLRLRVPDTVVEKCRRNWLRHFLQLVQSMIRVQPSEDPSLDSKAIPSLLEVAACRNQRGKLGMSPSILSATMTSLNSSRRPRCHIQPKRPPLTKRLFHILASRSPGIQDGSHFEHRRREQGDQEASFWCI